MLKVNDKELAALADWSRLAAIRRRAARAAARRRGHPRRRRARRSTAKAGTIESPACARAPAVTTSGAAMRIVAILVHGMTLGWDLATCAQRGDRWAAAVASVRGATPRSTTRRSRTCSERLHERRSETRREDRMPTAPAEARSRARTRTSSTAAQEGPDMLGPLRRLAHRARCPARARRHHDRGLHHPLALFRGETAGDDLSFHFAESARIADCLRHFDFDLWNPSANGGYASAYYYQVLPQLASALPAAIFGHHLFWFQLSVVLPLVLAPAAAYRGMRLLGATPWQAAARGVLHRVHERRVALGRRQRRHVPGRPLHADVGARRVPARARPCRAVDAAGQEPRARDRVGRVRVPVPSVRRRHARAHSVHGVARAAMLVLLRSSFRGARTAAARATGSYASTRRAVGSIRRSASWLRRARARRDPRGRCSRHVAAGLAAAVIDREGFGGFPHRVGDEVGPGFKGLLELVHERRDPRLAQPNDRGTRLALLTMRAADRIAVRAREVPIAGCGRPRSCSRCCSASARTSARSATTLFPPVRALGAMQTVLAMGIGAGAIIVGTQLWQLVGEGSATRTGLRTAHRRAARPRCSCSSRCPAGGRSARACACSRTTPEQPPRRAAADQPESSRKQPQGRKQAGPGAENHWWNLLSYAYEPRAVDAPDGRRRPAGEPELRLLVDAARLREERVDLRRAVRRVHDVARQQDARSARPSAKTENYEIRKLPSPGPRVAGPGHRRAAARLSPRPSRATRQRSSGSRAMQPMNDEVLAYAGSGGRRTAPSRPARCARGGKTRRATTPTSSPRSRPTSRRRSRCARAGTRAGTRISTANESAGAPRDARLPRGRRAGRQAHARDALRAPVVDARLRGCCGRCTALAAWLVTRRARASPSRRRTRPRCLPDVVESARGHPRIAVGPSRYCAEPVAPPMSARGIGTTTLKRRSCHGAVFDVRVKPNSTRTPLDFSNSATHVERRRSCRRSPSPRSP